jgi:hypothetical protein
MIKEIERENMKGVAEMGVYLGQLPPADLARLKAELAETLIANFCYPRFFDHRTKSLRMRPVGRAKRQEVWLYLSSIDFTTWNRVDLSSSDFQRHIEKLIVYFVQRNRSYFGQQGRKRMPDVRMLISSCSSTIAEGMRGHLMGRQSGNIPFGSPRPSISWSTTNESGYPEPNWEQIVSATMVLQQQLQELRGEIKFSPAPLNEAVPTALRPKQAQKIENGLSRNGVGHEVKPLHAEPLTNAKSNPQAAEYVISSPAAPTPPQTGDSGRALPYTKGDGRPSRANLTRQDQGAGLVPPLEPETSITALPKPRTDAVFPFIETPTVPTPIVETSVTGTLMENAPAPSPMPEQAQPVAISTSPASQPLGLVRSPQPRQSPNIPQEVPPPQLPLTGKPANLTRSETPVINEDVAIFERMHQQLVLWLRIEAVRLDLDIVGRSPLQLLELLRQHNGFDETRLQIASTLLNLSNQVMKTGEASLLDYKQGLMFYLVHTKQ